MMQQLQLQSGKAVSIVITARKYRYNLVRLIHKARALRVFSLPITIMLSRTSLLHEIRQDACHKTKVVRR